MPCIVFNFKLCSSLSVEREEEGVGERRQKERSYLNETRFFPLHFCVLFRKIQFRQIKNRTYTLITMINSLMVWFYYYTRWTNANARHHTQNTSNQKTNFHNCMIKCVTVRLSLCLCVCVNGRNLHAYVKFLRWKMR